LPGEQAAVQVLPILTRLAVLLLGALANGIVIGETVGAAWRRQARGTAVRIVVLPGDGIGPEISAAAAEVLGLVNRDLGLGLEFETHEIGLLRLKTSGTTFPAAVLERCRAADSVLLGPVSHSDYPGRAEGRINVSAELRIALDLYANIRPSPRRHCWCGTPGVST
jgi:isocitrate/isopropylmalate dehydrogenase